MKQRRGLDRNKVLRQHLEIPEVSSNTTGTLEQKKTKSWTPVGQAKVIKPRSSALWLEGSIILGLHLGVRLMRIKASLTFKCMTEHLFADFSYSIALDTYLWKQMMQMNRKLIHIWYNVDKKHLLFTKSKCHKFSWLFTASRCSPRKRSICACRIACKVLVSIGLYWLSFGF